MTLTPTGKGDLHPKLQIWKVIDKFNSLSRYIQGIPEKCFVKGKEDPQNGKTFSGTPCKIHIDYSVVHSKDIIKKSLKSIHGGLKKDQLVFGW